MEWLSSVLVCGDATVDWLLAIDSPAPEWIASYRDSWGAGDRLAAFPRGGGCIQLAELLGASAGLENQHHVALAADVSDDEIRDPAEGRLTKSYSVWAPFPRAIGHHDATAWRVREFRGNDEPPELRAEVPESDAAGVVVIDDANLGFRQSAIKNREWLQGLRDTGASVIVKRVSPLIGDDALWAELIANEHCAVTALVSIGDLRRDGAPLCKGLSWERLAWELYSYLMDHPLRRCGCLVVTVSLAGAFIWGRDQKIPTLVYDPCSQEDDWQAGYPGMMIGYGSCMTTALAVAAAAGKPGADVDAVIRGLQGARTLHRVGYGGEASSTQIAPLECPVGQVSREFLSDMAPGHSCAFHATDAEFSRDTTLARKRGADTDDLARGIVLNGFAEAVESGVPLEQIGEWVSVDRAEIEGIRSVRGILARYLATQRQRGPLSIGVFGPPGAGKSFAVRELIANVSRVPTMQMTFNMTQFRGLDELAVAFHRITDASLQGRVPIVFWDEFDIPLEDSELGWLRYFLMPMQDGVFYHQQLTFYLGGAVFVFAGGTHSSMAEFCEKSEREELKPMKVRDFISRLAAYIDVRGPNRFGDAAGVIDEGHMLRRGVLLRSSLERLAPQIIGPQGRMRIHEGVLTALLRVDEYKHGARSMNSIIASSDLDGRSSFQPASLPAPAQLGLHVDAGSFLSLVRGEHAAVRTDPDK